MENNVQTMTGKGSPEFKHLVFSLNTDTGYYEMIQGAIGFFKVPNELKLEETQNRQQIKSDYIIRSRVKNNKYLFFTGIIKTLFNYWYFGDFFEIRNGIKRNSFILFHFSKDQTKFEMFFFNHFKLYPSDREQFIRNFINNLKR